MFYELKHSLSADYCKVESGEDFSFPAHMHHCFEWIMVTEGVMTVEVGEESFTLSAGESVLIFPNQIHSMQTPGHSRHMLCLFSPRLVSAYTEKTAGRIPLDNRFALDGINEADLRRAASDNPILLKGLLYTICGRFDESAQYGAAGNRSDMLLCRIFLFVEENYHTDASLSALARRLGYDYAYLSHYFKKATGMTYNAYLSQYRISQACYLLENQELNIISVAVECGFNSLRSLNRQFRAQTGQTPSEYRAAWLKKSPGETGEGQ